MICPQCQTQNEPAALRCIHCSRSLIPAIPVVPPFKPSIIPLPNTTTTAPPAPAFLVCPVCGAYFSPWHWCPYCQTPLGTLANPNDSTCNTFLQIGYPYPEAEETLTDAPPTAHRPKRKRGASS